MMNLVGSASNTPGREFRRNLVHRKFLNLTQGFNSVAAEMLTYDKSMLISLLVVWELSGTCFVRIRNSRWGATKAH